MYSSWQRIQAVSSLATSCIMALLLAIALAGWAAVPSVQPGVLEVAKLEVAPGTGHNSRMEFALLRFNLQADLSPLFSSWNTKQVYASVTADYNNTATGTTDSVVVWDRIITRRRPREARLNIKGGRGKNSWKGPAGTFRNIPSAALTLRYDIMPYVGALVPGVAARARNPAYRAGHGAGAGGLGEWEFAMPRVKAGGIAK